MLMLMCLKKLPTFSPIPGFSILLMKQFLYFFFIACLLYSCIDIDRDDREQQLTVRYRVEYSTYDRRLRAEAELRLRDTLEVQPYFLEQPVRFNGADMTKRFGKSRGLYYVHRATTALPDTLAFDFTDYQGRSRTVATYMTPIERISIAGSDYYDNGFSVRFTDPGELADSVAYTLLLVDAANVLHHLDTLPRTTEGRATVVPERLAEVAPGRATLLFGRISTERSIRDGIAYHGILSWVSRPLYIRMER